MSMEHAELSRFTAREICVLSIVTKYKGKLSSTAASRIHVFFRSLAAFQTWIMFT